MNFYIGIFYFVLHSCLIYSSIFLYLFNTDLIILSVLFINIMIIYLCNYMYEDCPIDLIEEYYFGDSRFYRVISTISEYTNTNEHENILQLILLFLIVIFAKILSILITPLKID